MEGVNRTIDEQVLLEELNTEMIIKNIPTMVFVSVINILGITGNIITILFYRTKKLTNSSLLISVLAIIDLFTCIILFDQVIFLRFMFMFTSDAACKLFTFLNFSFLSSSILIMFLICIERHRKLCRPFGWQFSIRSCKWTIACLIVFACVWNAKTIPSVAIVKLNLTASDGTMINGYICGVNNDQSTIIATLRNISSLSDTVVVLLIVALIVILYLHIGRTVLKSRKKLKVSFGIFQGQSSSSSSTCIHDRVVEIRNNSVNSQGDTQMKDAVSFRTLNIPVSSHETGDTTDYEINRETNNLQNQVATQDHVRRITVTELNDNSRDIKQIKAKEKAYVHKVEQTMTLISGMIALGYIVCFIPYFIVAFYVQRNDINTYELGIGMAIVSRSYLFNSAINPFIIVYFNTDFRKYIKDFLCKGRHCLK